MAAIDRFTLVQIAGIGSGGKPTVSTWNPSAWEEPTLSSGHKILGVAMTNAEFEEPIAVMKRGYMRAVLSPGIEAPDWAVGDILYGQSDGSITNSRPAGPLPQVVVGTVFLDEGSFYFTIDVDVRVLPNIGELTGVAQEAPVNLDVFIYNSTSHCWTPRQIDHGGDIAGLLDDDHTQYLKEKASGGLAAEIPTHTHADANNAGTINHTVLTNLTANDHPQYKVRHGFVRDSAGNHLVTMSYNGTSRVLTVTPTGSNFDFYINSVKFTKTGAQASSAHAATLGKWFLTYASNGNLTWNAVNTSWSITDLTATPVAMVYYYDANHTIAFFEAHESNRNLALHYNLHFTQGTKYVSGMSLSGYNLNADDDANVTFAISSGVIADEDISHAITGVADNGAYTVLYRTGANGDWTYDDTPTYPFLSGTTYPKLNAISNGAWATTEISGTGLGEWINYYLVAIPAVTAAKQLCFIPGQVAHGSLASADGESLPSLSLGTLPVEEIAPIYKITYHAKSTYGGTHKVQIKRVTDIKTLGASILSSATSPSVHNSLSGRSASDAHPASSITITPFTNGAFDVAATDLDTALKEIGDELALDSLVDVDAPSPSDNYVLTWINGNSAWEAQPAQGGASALDDLTDVDAPAPSDNYVLTWVNGNSAWEAQPAQGGASALDDLTDVDAAAPNTGDTIVWNGTSLAWEAEAPGVGALGLDDLSDVVLTNTAANHTLIYNGSNWVNQVLPAGASALDDLTDVDAGAPNTGDTIVWNGTSMAWEAGAPGVGALGLDDLSDVVIANAAANHTLVYNGSTWVNQTAVLSLDGLSDVVIANAAANHTLVYNGSSWVNQTEPSHALNDLSDVVIANAAANHTLVYNGSSWVNQLGGGGGGGTVHRQFRWSVFSPLNGVFPLVEMSANCAVKAVRVIHTGSGGLDVNVIKNYRGSPSDILNTNLTSNSTAWVNANAAAGSVSMASGDELDVEILNTAGYVEYVTLVVDVEETL